MCPYEKLKSIRNKNSTRHIKTSLSLHQQCFLHVAESYLKCSPEAKKIHRNIVRYQKSAAGAFYERLFICSLFDTVTGFSLGSIPNLCLEASI